MGPVRCCNCKSSLQLPCDFDVMRKSFIGSGVFMRFLFNQNKAVRRGRQSKGKWQPKKQFTQASNQLNEEQIVRRDSESLVRCHVCTNCWRSAF